MPMNNILGNIEGLVLHDSQDLLGDCEMMSDKPLVNYKQKNIFEQEKRKSWEKVELARCNFNKDIRLTPRAGLLFFSYWKKTRDGRTLVDIKADENMIPYFAEHITWLIQHTIGEFLDQSDFAICTTPKRRHLVNNFAENITKVIAQNLNLRFYEDVALCKTKHRVNAIFDINNLPEERNIIIVDDFVTTGSTFESIKRALTPFQKNLSFFTGINNKL